MEEATHQRADSMIAAQANPTNDSKRLQITTVNISSGSGSSSPAIAPYATNIPAEEAGLQLPAPLQQDWQKRRIHRWKSPLMMVVFFLVGLAMSLAHCIFYPSLQGKIVGNSDAQEEKIRQVLLAPRYPTAADRFPDSEQLSRSWLRSASVQPYGQATLNGSGVQ
jgi:thiol:disulfide interchange protein